METTSKYRFTHINYNNMIPNKVSLFTSLRLHKIIENCHPRIVDLPLIFDQPCSLHPQ